MPASVRRGTDSRVGSDARDAPSDTRRSAAVATPPWRSSRPHGLLRRRAVRHPRRPARARGGACRARRALRRPRRRHGRPRCRTDARARPSTGWSASASGACWCAATPTASWSPSPGAAPASTPSRVWAAAQLRPDQVDLLDGLPHPVTLDVDGFGPVVFCHGTPRDDDEVVLVDTRLERWAEVLSALPAGVYDGGVRAHAHAVRPARRPPARGQPGQRRYAVRPGGRRVGPAPRRPGQPAAHARSTSMPCADASWPSPPTPTGQAWADEYVRSRNSDADALTAFAPRDGRLPHLTGRQDRTDAEPAQPYVSRGPRSLGAPWPTRP